MKSSMKSAKQYYRSDSSDSESNSGTEESLSDDEEYVRKRKRRKNRKEDDERSRKNKKNVDKEKKRQRKKRKEKRKEETERSRVKRKKNKAVKMERGRRGPITNTWGKYGIIRETDMWNKRPEFSAWLAEVKQVNLETLPNWQEKQMFKEFMEDHNTATFPSRKYYDLNAYYMRKLEKEKSKGLKIPEAERTVFNDEEQLRQQVLWKREKLKEEQVAAIKRSMQCGMAQAMKEQAHLREEMAYQYKLGNFEAAAAIQRRLDPDATNI